MSLGPKERIYDALGTKQYVARLNGGVTFTGVSRLNRNDQTYRVNLDVVPRGDRLHAVYNDARFGIRYAEFTGPADFSAAVARTIVPRGDTMWPTPNLVLSSTAGAHLYFWGGTSSGGGAWSSDWIHHWRGRAPARTILNLTDATSNSALPDWPAANATDGNASTSYSSECSVNPSNGAWLAAWVPGRRPQLVNQAVLTARRREGAVQGFPVSYQVFVTSPDNRRWDVVGSFSTQPNAQGRAVVDLGNDYWTSGLMVLPTELGADAFGNRCFQLAEMSLAY